MTRAAKKKQSGRYEAIETVKEPRDGQHLLLIVACFFLSGFAALLYQTVWLRQLATVFGTSELAVAAVLAAYMGGLALGAALMRRFVDRIQRVVLVYGVLEAAIAVSALAMPFLFAGMGRVYVWLLGGQADVPASATAAQPLFYLLATFIVLALPTICMGATLPLLTRHVVKSQRQVGPRIGLLYSLNTFGAVTGTLVAAFVLLPALGLWRTVLCGALVNGLVFVIAAVVARRDSGSVIVAEPEIVAVQSKRYFLILPFIAVSGAVSFCYEVLWTRLLSHVIGGSIYAFAIMLSAFLTGIALGGALGGWLAKRSDVAITASAAMQLGIAVAAAMAYFGLEAALPAERTTFAFALYAIIIMLPATLLIGATFPLAVRVLAQNDRDAPGATARVYSWNTTGAIIGALLAGFVLIPELGFELTNKLAVSLNACLGVSILVFMGLKTARKIQRWQLAAAVAIAIAAVVIYTPNRPDAVVRSIAFAVADDGAETEVFYGVGRSATVLVTESSVGFNIRTNGLPEAAVPARGRPPIGQVHHWLAGLPYLANPTAESMLVVGLGGAVGVENLPARLKDIDVIELEPQVIAANRAISTQRTVDPLADPRLNIIINDARNALRLTSRKYDIIVSQPSHPWTAGASHLYTYEFAQLAKTHLTDSGVFLQWVGAGFVDESLLAGLARNLLDTYANVRLYQTRAAMLFLLASDQPLDIEASVLRTREPLRSNVLYYSYMGINGVADILASLVLDEQGVVNLAAQVKPITDDFNRMATDSRFLADGLSVPDLIEQIAEHDPLTRDGWVSELLQSSVDPLAVTSRLLRDGFTARARRFANTLNARNQDGETVSGAKAKAVAVLAEAFVASAEGRFSDAQQGYIDALSLDQSFNAARFALLEPLLPALAAGRAGADADRLATGLTGSAASVLRGWRLAARGNTQALAAMDRELAAATPDDLWYPEAVQLRADWRLQINGDPKYAFDAMRLIDRALLVRSRTDLLILRVAAANILDDRAAVIESARVLAETLNDRLAGPLAVTPREANGLLRQLTIIRAQVDSLGADSHRAPAVGELLTIVMSRLTGITRGD